MRFFLSFPQIPEYSKVEITEPVKMDGVSFSTVREDDGFAIDTTKGADEISLEFYYGFFDPCEPYQTPDGVVREHLSMGFDFIKYAVELYGIETEIRFITESESFVKEWGILDIKNWNTNYTDKIIVKIAQDLERSLIKKNEDTSIDMFSNKGLFGNDITPIQIEKFWLNGLPQKQTSKWSMKEPMVQFAGGSRFVNWSVQSDVYGIHNSLVPFYPTSGINDLGWAVNNFQYIRAEDDLTDITVTCDLDIDFVYRTVNGDDQSFAYIGLYWYVYDEPWTIGSTYQFGTAYEKMITGADAQDFHLPSQVEFTVPNIGRGQVLAWFWNLDWDITNAAASTTQQNDFIQGLSYVLALHEITFLGAPVSLLYTSNGSYSPDGPTKWIFNKANISATATATPLSSMVNSVRYIDLHIQTAKSINGFPIISPEFMMGGKFYNNFAFSTNMIRQRNDAPFIMKWNELRKSLQEFCADSMVNSDHIYIGEYPTFYQNKDMGAFYVNGEETSDTDNDYSETYAPKHCISTFKFSYSKFEQESSEGNTIDGVHTQTEWHNGNKQAINVKEIVLPQIRDDFAIRTAQKQNIQILPDTSLATDNDWYLMDGIEISPDFVYVFQKRLLQRVSIGDSNRLQILNNDSDGDGAPLNWLVMGITLGQELRITYGTNQGVFTVINIEPASLTLQKVSGSTLEDSNTIIKLEYQLTGVSWTSRTNQGFDLITGVESPNLRSNLRYTPKNLMVEQWGHLLSTWRDVRQSGEYSRRFYKNAPVDGVEWLKTQFEGGTIYDHKANVNFDELPRPIVSPKFIYATRVKMSYSQAVNLWSDIETKRGFIRVVDQLGNVRRVFPNTINWLMVDEIATIDGEIGYEDGMLNIVSSGNGSFIVNMTEYNQLISDNWYEAIGDSVRLFDNNDIPITNFYHYSKVRINGRNFTNILELVSELR